MLKCKETKLQLFQFFIEKKIIYLINNNIANLQ